MTWRACGHDGQTRVQHVHVSPAPGTARPFHLLGRPIVWASVLGERPRSVRTGRREFGTVKERELGTVKEMVSWTAFEEAEPALARRVRTLFDAGRHKTIATLRADGSPRISGIECEFTDSDLTFGSMAGARKSADLLRDPRFALHGPTFHPEEGKEGDWPGEAKVAGRAVSAGPVPTEGDDQHEGDMFVADIDEVAITGLDAEATHLVIETWTPDRGLRRIERS